MSTKIILLGRDCRVSFDIRDINLKSATSLFEWVLSESLSEINFIIKKLINNDPITIVRINGADFMEGTTIHSCHYLTKDYNQIMIRRSKRFLNDIRTNKNIIFIRDDMSGNIKMEEIEDFCALIKKFNPETNFKLLLLSAENSFNEFKYDNLCHKKYNKSLLKDYINECYNIDTIQTSTKFDNDLSDN